MPLPNDDWEEIHGWPCHYMRRAYTPDEIARLNRRPTELINAALSRNVTLEPQALLACDDVISESELRDLPRQVISKTAS